MKLSLRAILIIVTAWISLAAADGETPAGGRFADPGAMVAGIYDAVSVPAGGQADWDSVRAFFDPQAVIVLRATRDATRLMDVDAFIQDFVDFYDRLGPGVGFKERVVSIRTMKYGNVAHSYVVYEVLVEGSDRPPQRGLDSWHLMLRDGRWWIVSVVNESEVTAGPIPDVVFGG